MQALFKTMAAACLALAMQPSLTMAQDYPTRPVRLVVPYTAGGTTDVLARVAAQHMGATLGQPVIVENRPGGNTMIAAESVARAPADGYTLLLATTTTMLNTALYQRISYRRADFTPIAAIAKSPFVLAVAPSMPARNVAELIALSHSRPQGLNNAIIGQGNTSHLTAELFRRATGAAITDVPYRGMAQAMTDVLAGTVDLMFDGTVQSLPAERAGTVRLLGVSTETRLEAAPDLPTFAEQGYPSVVSFTWYGIMAPAGTPPAVVLRLAAAVRSAHAEPEFRRRIIADGGILETVSGAEFGRFIDEDMARWTTLVRAMDLRLE